jgi:hypothetical protein
MQNFSESSDTSIGIKTNFQARAKQHINMDNDEELLSAENFADQILKSASNGNFMAI